MTAISYGIVVRLLFFLSILLRVRQSGKLSGPERPKTLVKRKWPPPEDEDSSPIGIAVETTPDSRREQKGPLPWDREVLSSGKKWERKNGEWSTNYHGRKRQCRPQGERRFDSGIRGFLHAPLVLFACFWDLLKMGIWRLRLGISRNGLIGITWWADRKITD